MRRFLILVGVVLVLLGLGWFGGERWLAKSVQDQITASDDLRAKVGPLGDPTALGLRLREVEAGDDVTGIRLPHMDIYANLLSLNRFRLRMPQEFTLVANGAAWPVTLASGAGMVALAPLHRMAIKEVDLAARGVEIEHIPSVDNITLNAVLVHRGAQSPSQAGAAYQLRVDATGVSVRGQPDLDKLDLLGDLRLWFTHAPGPVDQDIFLVGGETDGLDLHLGDLSARILGRVEPDADGMASGKIILETAHAAELIKLAADQGIIAPGIAPMAQNMIDQMKNADSTAHILRLPVTLAKGEMRFGPFSLGPAPRLIPAR